MRLVALCWTMNNWWTRFRSPRLQRRKSPSSCRLPRSPRLKSTLLERCRRLSKWHTCHLHCTFLFYLTFDSVWLTMRAKLSVIVWCVWCRPTAQARRERPFCSSFSMTWVALTPCTSSHSTLTSISSICPLISHRGAPRSMNVYRTSMTITPMLCTGSHSYSALFHIIFIQLFRLQYGVVKFINRL